MALTYRCGKEVIELALEKLKADGLVSDDAYFNYAAPQNLRKEVAYRDFDFLSRLGRVAEAEILSSALEMLKQLGCVGKEAAFEETAFKALRDEVKEKFSMPGSSVSPVMERLMYMLSALKRPKRALGIGTYYGNGLVWCVGASCGIWKTYQAEKIYGIDIDPEATRGAKENFERLANSDHIELLTEDGLEAVARLEGPFDYVFLDVDSKELGKGLYLDLVKKVYDKVQEGGWVLAHDIVVPPFAEQLEGYLEFVRDKANFKESILFDVDAYGLELSIK
jgi:predicted O-methyltransferase YrrM